MIEYEDWLNDIIPLTKDRSCTRSEYYARYFPKDFDVKAIRNAYEQTCKDVAELIKKGAIKTK